MIEEKLVTWERIDADCRGIHMSIRRAKIPGGWLLYACDSVHHHGGLTFVPDPDHRWDGNSLP